MTLLTIWLTAAAAYFMVVACLSIVAFYGGKWEVMGLDGWREHAAHALMLGRDWAGQALAWPLTLLLLLVKWPTYNLQKLQGALDKAATAAPLMSGSFKMPPQDERSQAQLDTLDLQLTEELRAQLGVSPLVKFYPLMRHSWLEFQAGVKREAPFEVDDETLQAFFLQFAQGFAKGDLK